MGNRLKNKNAIVTAAGQGMKKNEIKKYPLSGNLFKVKTNSKGKKSNSFKTLHVLS